MKNHVYLETCAWKYPPRKRKANWPIFLVLASAFTTAAAIGAFVVGAML